MSELVINVICLLLGGGAGWTLKSYYIKNSIKSNNRITQNHNSAGGDIVAGDKHTSK